MLHKKIPSISLTLLLLLACLFPTAAKSDLMAIRGNFENTLQVPPGTNPLATLSSSATCFGGNIGDAAVADGSVVLEQSSFYQIVSCNIPYPSFVEEAVNTALGMLYWDKAPPEDREDAAFVYKVKMYDKGDAEQYIKAQFADIADFWDNSRRARAMDAAQILLDTLKYAPWNRTLRWTVLDIYYDIAVADAAVAKQKMVEAYKQSLGLVAPPPGEFLISNEIALMEDALELYRFALSGYFALLKDYMGVDTAPYDAAGVPFGYYLFKTEVPQRNLYSPLMKDAEGHWVLPADFSGDEEAVKLFSGYKDIVLIFDVERDYAAAAAELARRYILRGAPATETEPSDLEKAAALIDRTQQQSYLEYALFTGIFPEIAGDMKSVDADSGLLESANSWQTCVSELSHLQAYLNGDSNLLGFTDDFLVLVQSQIPGNPGTQYFDSYDFFAEYLDPGVTSELADRPLKKALDAFDTARTEYANYRDRSDELFLEFSDRNAEYDTRLLEIVGVPYGDPGYDDPLNNPGGLLYQQYKSIEIARTQIEANKQELDNLKEQIEIEIWRRGQESGINNAIQQIYIDYGDKQADLAKEIGDLEAWQKFSDNMAQSIASVSYTFGSGGGLTIGGGAAAFAANAAVQLETGKKIADKKKQMEKNAAAERAAVKSKEDDLLDVNSQAQIKTWYLQMNTLAIDSQEAALTLSQEVGRLAGLISEKEYLERSRAETNEALADRYFADPVHCSLKDYSIIRAEHYFEYAQRWMYFAVRALEYKWNQSFVQYYAPSQCTFTADTLLQLRNAKELEDMYYAMAQWDVQQVMSGRSDNGYKKFSLRQDFLGYAGDPDEISCADPITGEPATPLDAFRSYLSKDEIQLSHDDPENPLRGVNAIKLPFSTVINDPTANFFSRNRWNEKIKWMRVKVYGAYIEGKESFVEGYLVYGGTNYIRNATEGYVDPENPDLVVDEMRAYDSRYWYYDNELAQWQFKDVYGVSLPSVEVSNDPDVPPEVSQIDLFKEKSIATSEWILYLPVSAQNGSPVMNMDTISDIEIHFYYYWYARN